MSLATALSCLDGYDPDALRVDKAREAILSVLGAIRGVTGLLGWSALRSDPI